MAVDMGALLADLAAETRELTALLDGLDDRDWDRPTPAEGWRIHDQVTHLAYFDEAATTSVVDPDRFRADLAEALADPVGIVDSIAARFASMPGAEAYQWFGRARAAMADAFRSADPAVRVPWYGPAMSPASSLTARIMETWAHGQDVADALGATREVTPALRNVAHIGVRALPNSYVTRGLAVPEVPVFVALRAPDGTAWKWGDADAADRVEGDAYDFCLVVTQRRHVADTSLTTTGPIAGEWMQIAQAFAGPPGPGRPPKSRA